MTETKQSSGSCDQCCECPECIAKMKALVKKYDRLHSIAMEFYLALTGVPGKVLTDKEMNEAVKATGRKVRKVLSDLKNEGFLT
jgi:transcription initiation factor IIE alpha subunit